MFGLTEGELTRVAAELNFPGYRKGQMEQWVYKKFISDFSQMTNLPRAARDQLAAKYAIVQSSVIQVRDSADAVKLLLEYPDGARVETVVITYRNWSSACLSTQVGCAMGCLFCASGASGLERNLTHGEIVEQLWHACRVANKRTLSPVRNVVLMGVGEPLANLDNVLQFIASANDPGKFNIGQRRITVSTLGLVPEILRLAGEKLSISLAISLHAPNERLRRQLMPATAGHNLQELMAACRKYTEVSGRRVTFEYLLLAEINDRECHAAELARLLSGMNCLINIIPYNPVPGVAFKPSRRTDQFRARMTGLGINTTIRRSLGGGISAACGQLRGERGKEGD